MGDLEQPGELLQLSRKQPDTHRHVLANRPRADFRRATHGVQGYVLQATLDRATRGMSERRTRLSQHFHSSNGIALESCQPGNPMDLGQFAMRTSACDPLRGCDPVLPRQSESIHKTAHDPAG